MDLGLFQGKQGKPQHLLTENTVITTTTQLTPEPQMIIPEFAWDLKTLLSEPPSLVFNNP